jgi:hypothetical protein
MKITNLKELREFMNQMPDVENPKWESLVNDKWMEPSFTSDITQFVDRIRFNYELRWKPIPKLEPYMPPPPFLVKWPGSDVTTSVRDYMATAIFLERFARQFNLESLVKEGVLHNAEGRDIWKPFTREVEG